MRLFEMLRGMFSSKGQASATTSDREASVGTTVSSSALGKMRVVELKALAKQRGLSGYSKLNKSQLLDLLD